jgi:ATP diphosphatase
MLARRRGVDPEAALDGTNRKFARRFAAIEAALAHEGCDVRGAGLARLDDLWNEAKERERRGPE